MKKLSRHFRVAMAVFMGVLLLQAGCSPRIYPIREQVQQPVLQSTYFIAADGVRLPLTVWKKDASPNAVIVGVHGFNDYRRAFNLPAEFLAAHGIHVYAYDQRGFGDTEHRGMWPGAQRLQDDLITLVKLIKNRHPDAPLFLLGDSMGGAVVTLTSINPGLPPIDGIILNAPAVWGNHTFNAFYRFGLWTLAHTVPWMEVTGKGMNITVTDNIPLLKELSKDPLMIRETRIDALYGMVHLMDQVVDATPSLAAPTLLLYGLKDEVIPRESVCRFATQLKTDHEVVFYQQGYHFLLRDLTAEKVWRDILDWVSGRFENNTALAKQACGIEGRKEGLES
jgi:alpha-beta hydrolase superfamily lysophospholipase